MTVRASQVRARVAGLAVGVPGSVGLVCLPLAAKFAARLLFALAAVSLFRACRGRAGVARCGALHNGAQRRENRRKSI